MDRRFELVDVFGSDAGPGNPVAVVHDAEGLSDDEMQAFARYVNLSETTFLFPPTVEEADYRVRIFTLARELPFAGHPTLGTCHSWLAAGGSPAERDIVVQECAVGLVPLRRGDRCAFAAPPLVRSGPVEEDYLDEVADVLGISKTRFVASEWVDNGPGWVGILLADAAQVLALTPDFTNQRSEGTLEIGVVGPHGEGADADFEVRAFFSDDKGAMLEDPVTGSLNASLAGWLLGSGRTKAPYVAAQGTQVGRAGRVFIDRDDDGTIWVGGATDTVVEGRVVL